jgi:putative membrane protein
MEYKRLLKSWVLIALGVLLASSTASGISYEDGQSLFFAVLLLSVFNLLLKPLLLLFSLPFIVLTLGLGIWLINALLFLWVGNLVPGFFVGSFGSALWGAFVVSLISGLANLLFGANRAKVKFNFSVSGHRPTASRTNKKQKPLKDDDDVIDI